MPTREVRRLWSILNVLLYLETNFTQREASGALFTLYCLNITISRQRYVFYRNESVHVQFRSRKGLAETLTFIISLKRTFTVSYQSERPRCVTETSDTPRTFWLILFYDRVPLKRGSLPLIYHRPNDTHVKHYI